MIKDLTVVNNYNPYCRLGTATIFYNDDASLIRNVESVTPYFDTIILIDGPFSGMPTPEVITVPSISFPTNPNVRMHSIFPATEAQKRNYYLELSKKYDLDFLLILDSDEYIVMEDYNEFLRFCIGMDYEYNSLFGNKKDVQNVIGVKSKNEYNDQYSDRPRLFYRPFDMIYEGVHYNFHRKDGRLIKSMNGSAPGIRIEHDKKLRTEDYTQKWKLFRQFQIDTEGN